MKKEYIKPAMIAESFIMTEHIAACAESSVELAVGFHQKENGCGISVMNGTAILFLEDFTEGACNFFYPVDEIEDYHGGKLLPQDLFGS